VAHTNLKFYENVYTLFSKKMVHKAHMNNSVRLLNRFSQFFHRQTRWKICNKHIIKDPATPKMCRNECTAPTFCFF